MSNTLYNSNKPIYNENNLRTVFVNNKSYERNLLVSNVFSIYNLTEINYIHQFFYKQTLLFSINDGISPADDKGATFLFVSLLLMSLVNKILNKHKIKKI